MKLALRNPNHAPRVCPLCRERVAQAASGCTACAAHFHPACVAEMRPNGCTTLGCSGELRDLARASFRSERSSFRLDLEQLRAVRAPAVEPDRCATCHQVASAALGLRRRCSGCQGIFHIRCLDSDGERCRPCARWRPAEPFEETTSLRERALLVLLWTFLTAVCVVVVTSVIGCAIAVGEAIPKLFVVFGG